MALNTLKCNLLTPLRFKRLMQSFWRPVKSALGLYLKESLRTEATINRANVVHRKNRSRLQVFAL